MLTVQSKNTNTHNTAGSSKKKQLPVYAGLFILLLVTILAYKSVLFDFFAGDDFVHLTWLKDAIQQPELIWRNFHSSWLDGTTTKFYRPLISIFMVSDYLLYGTNGTGFHVTNLLFHLASALLIYGICLSLFSAVNNNIANSREELAEPQATPQAKLWALASAALFSLYPLHVEAVSWITGRVDTIVTTFCLLSFWAYLGWRNSNRITLLVTSLVSFWLGLFSKEMAITLPALLVSYELLLGKNSLTITKPKTIPAAFIDSLKPTLIFWGNLALYFYVRKLALGTMVGGYDDSLFFISNLKTFALSWIHGLSMLFMPLNKEFLGSHHLLTRSWQLALIANGILFITGFLRNPKIWKLFFFVSSWFILSLAPVYKIFAISDDLQGSRLAYLATVPLALILAFALASRRNDKPGKSPYMILTACVVALQILLSGIILTVNNQAWAKAGQTSNAIRSGLKDLYSKLPGDPQVLLVGLPDQIHGAYISRNALWGMTKKPQFSQDIKNCQMVDRFEPIFPFGYLKDSIWQDRDKIFIHRFDQGTNTFQPVSLANDSAQDQTTKHLLAGKELELQGGPGFRGRPELELNCQGLSCWHSQFIAVTLELLSPSTQPLDIDLLYRNDALPKYNLRCRTHALIEPIKGEQTVYLSLHSLPEWSLGGKATGLKLMLPSEAKVKIKDVFLASPESLLPQISFANSGYLQGSKGYLHLSSTTPSQEIYYDASKVTGAKSVFLEVSRANLLFEEQNTKSRTAILLCQIPLSGLKGSYNIKLAQLQNLGIYEIRLVAKDAAGKQAGLNGDHIVISRNP
jgi:hypothetical protein